MNARRIRIPIPLEAGAARELAERVARESRAGNHEKAGLEEQAAAFRLYAEDRAQWEASGNGCEPVATPLVSVILPVRNRSRLLSRAIRSVQIQEYSNWECLVIDDGSSDDSVGEARRAAARDPRIRVCEQPHRGAAAARNLGLSEARGDLLTYLDSDNRYLPGYLAQMVAAFGPDDDEIQCLYAGLVVGDAPSGETLLYQEDDPDLRLSRNVTDLNVFAHRRELFEQLGGFDEQLRRLQDWDLILRYSAHSSPRRLPVVGTDYSVRAPDRISVRESTGFAYTRLLRKHRPPIVSGDTRPAVLCLHRPGSTWRVHEAPAALEAGFRVESLEVPAATERAIEEMKREFRPDVIHLQGEACARLVGDLVRSWNLPVTVRVDDVASLAEAAPWTGENWISRLEFPATRGLPSEPGRGVASLFRSGIDPDRFFPEPEPGTPGKWVITSEDEMIDPGFLDGFLATAALCPSHRFAVLRSASHADRSARIDSLIRAASPPHSAVSILVDLDADSRAAWMRQASFYMTRKGISGCTVAMVEALACGCLPLTDPESAAALFPPTGPVTAESPETFAEQIRATLTWSPEEWRSRVVNCLDIVFPYLTAMEASRDLFLAWKDLSTTGLRP